MGILNVTPDSFSDGGQHHAVDDAIAHAKRMVDEGALIIDVGGESTRPGAEEVSVEEELDRTVEVVRALAAQDICVSIDTRKPEVARACVEAGASVINDVTGFTDPAMVEVAANCDAGLIVMHWDKGGVGAPASDAVCRGGVEAPPFAATRAEGASHPSSQPMQPTSASASTLKGGVQYPCRTRGSGDRGIDPSRENSSEGRGFDPSSAQPMHLAVTDATAFQGDIVAHVCDCLRSQASMLEAAGVARDRIAIDPGPGFGKTGKQSLELMRNLQELVHLGYPVVAAPSRKRYVGEAYGIENAADRDEASATEALMACELGASVVRMHNVATTAAMLEHLRPYCVLALGANVALVGTDEEIQESLIAQLNQAIADLCLLPDSQLIDVSSFYESEPAYVEDQEKFVNAVVLLRTSLAPRDMLRYIHAIEDRLGRVRTLRNGPRTCDIDILDYQLYVSNDEELTLPHPRILERDFVVKPLLEILPGHVLSDGTLVTSDHVSLGWAKQITREKL